MSGSESVPSGLVFKGILPFFLSVTAFATPQLRLLNTVIGPVSVAVGSSGPAQSIDSYNYGDGTLSLSLTSSATWAVPSLGTPKNCGILGGICTPINVALQTASLAKGSYTALVTVSDPKAIDAPQTISVTVQVGGGLPDKLEVYAAPNGVPVGTRYYTNGPLVPDASTQSGGSWLSMSLEGNGSFRFVMPYRIEVVAPVGMSAGTYSGNVATSNSNSAFDNKQIPVTLRVTTQPIAYASSAAVRFRIAQGSAKQKNNVLITNRGLGTLALSTAAATSTTGGTWLSAEALPAYNVVSLTADSANLSPGTYTGSVTVNSNAANGPLVIPATLEVIAAGAPWAFVDGAVNNASFEADEPLALGDLVALFGEQFTTGDPLGATALPLSTQLGETQVFVNDQAVPLFYSSYNQINFQIPYNTALGKIQIRVDRGGNRGNTIIAEVQARSPRVLRLGIGDYGIIVNQDGSFPIPVTPGLSSHPAKAGDALVIYAIGLGPTTPGVVTGAASPATEPLARALETTVYFGWAGIAPGVPATALFSGLTPGFVGLYQINVIVPQDCPRGDNVPIRVTLQGGASNLVQIAVK